MNIDKFSSLIISTYFETKIIKNLKKKKLWRVD